MSLASCRGWVPLVLLPVAVLALVPSDWPRWALMWLLALAIFCGCKWLTWRRAWVRASWQRHLGYWIAWPGMDAKAFLSSDNRRPVSSPAMSSRG